MTIDGYGLSLNASDNDVSLGGTPCLNVTVGPAGGADPALLRLRCRVDASSSPAGRRPLSVAVRGKGLAVWAGDGGADGGLSVQFLTLAVSWVGLSDDTAPPANASAPQGAGNETGGAPLAAANNGTSPPPRRLDDGGFTLFAVGGSGFDAAACASNVVSVGGVACAVASCSAGRLLVWYPGQQRQGTVQPSRRRLEQLADAPATVDVKVGGGGSKSCPEPPGVLPACAIYPAC
jgi:hypothetical protein